jgi:hypothetical protein
MAKRAVVLGVNSKSSQGYLQAAAKEAKNWANVLGDVYSFAESEIHLLVNEEATRKRVLKELDWLFSGAAAGDRLVFIFCGHGTKTFGWTCDDEQSDEVENGLVLAPEDPDSDAVARATLTPDDFTCRIKQYSVPADARLWITIDACFGFSVAESARRSVPMVDGVAPHILYIPNPAVESFAIERSFYDLTDQGESASLTPLLVAAAGPNQAASEVEILGERRLLFSYHAINTIDRADAKHLSSFGLVTKVNNYVKTQTAVVKPDSQRADEPFIVGGLPIPRPLTDAKRTDTPTLTPTVQQSFYIRVFGMATVIDREPPWRAEEFNTRIVLPVDTQAKSPDDEHRPWLEIADRDLHNSDPAAVDNVLRGGVRYRRWSLNGCVMRLAGVANSGRPLARTKAFDDHVPSLPYICKSLKGKRPRGSCFHEVLPDMARVAAYVDFQGGTIDAGDLEKLDTVYRPRYKGTPEITIRTPTFVIVELAAVAEWVIILIGNAKNQTTVIRVRPGAEIVVGNARESDFNGPGNLRDAPEHFLDYYRLARDPDYPEDPVLPDGQGVPINACTVTGFP